MTLADYIAKHGVRAKATLAEATGLRWQTIHEIAEGRSEPKIATARKIEEATGGEVSAAELMGLAADSAEAAS